MNLTEQIEYVNPDVIVLKAPHYLLNRKRKALMETERISFSKKIPLLLDFSGYEETRDLVLNKFKYLKIFSITNLLNASENMKRPKIAVGGAHLDIRKEKRKIIATRCISDTIDDIFNICYPFNKKPEIYVLGGITLSDRDIRRRAFYVDRIFHPKFGVSHAYLS